MIYRVDITLYFEEEDACDDIWDKTLDHQDDAVVINPGKPTQDTGFARVSRCFHDETPNRPCELIREWIPPVPSS